MGARVYDVFSMPYVGHAKLPDLTGMEWCLIRTGR